MLSWLKKTTENAKQTTLDDMVVNSTARMHARFCEKRRTGGTCSSVCGSPASSTDSLPTTAASSGAAEDLAEQQTGIHRAPQADEGAGSSTGSVEPPLVFFGTSSGTSPWDRPEVLPESGGGESV
jgi:hypothetical protein